MVNEPTFGRRTALQRQSLRATAKLDPAPPITKSVFAGDSVDQSSVAQWKTASPDVDDGLQEWKRGRKHRSKIFWRQLALMASLCFGIASLVLPDSVNDILDWTLYALMAASLYAGLSGRWHDADTPEK
jgi:hypothetical protein